MKAPSTPRFNNSSNHFQVNQNKRFARIIHLIILIAAITLRTQGQEKLVNSYGAWNTITFTGKLNPNWSVAGELNLRRTGFSSEWQQIVARPYLSYAMGHGISGSFGYSYVQNFHFSTYSIPIDASENNLWQQLLWTHRIPKSFLTHRIRFEERFIDNIVTDNETIYVKGTNYLSRLRYRATIAIPLKTFTNNQSLTFVAYDELFFNFEQGTLPKSIEQNWLFAGLRYRINDRFSIKSGYNFTHNESRNDIVYENHIWLTFLNYQLF